MKKRICFLTVRNIFAISCLPRYKELIGKNSFDIIYWDRYNMEESCGAENHYVMKYPAEVYDSKWRKLYGYIKFIFYAGRLLSKGKYDAVILLPTQTGIMFKNVLKKKFKGRYIIDIRDYTMENNKFYFRLVEDLIKHSGLAVITSPAYKKFLPEHNYLISHNIMKISGEFIRNYREKKHTGHDKIVISCIGGIRFYEQFKKVIKCFANDERYLLKFIGDGSEGLIDFCNQKKVENVELLGRFTQDKTLSYYENTDIIMNLYGNNSRLLDYALSNKLYYAATLGMPILVCPGTYMEEIAVGSGFGFTFNLDDSSMCDKLYEYYNSVNWKSFYKNCDDFMQKVHADNNEFEKSVLEFIDKL